MPNPKVVGGAAHRSVKATARQAPASEEEITPGNRITRDEPIQVRFFLADDAREEMSRKLTLTGLFADGVVVLPKRPDIPIGAQRAIANLVIVASITAPAGEHEVVLHLLQPGGIPMAEPLVGTVTIPAPGKSCNLIVRLGPMPVPALGIYRLELELIGRTIGYSFEVRESNEEIERSAFGPLQATKPKSQTASRSTSRKRKVAARAR